MKSVRFLACAALAACNSVAQTPPDQSFDEERPWEEIVAALPDLPAEADLTKIDINTSSGHRYYLDQKSLRVDKDGVVRYTMVVDAAGGARNIIYEGIRCETREKKVYSVGRDNGTWGKVQGLKWERITNRGLFGYHQALFQDYFCPGKQIVASREEALDAIKRGIHPRAEPRR